MLPVKLAKENPAEKRRRLHALRNETPYATQSSLGAIVQHITDHGLPSERGCSRHQVRRARDHEVLQTTPLGPLMRTIEVPSIVAGETFKYEVACPLSSLYVAAPKKHFARLLWKTYLKSPPTVDAPWGVIFYSDEVTPGNAMKANNERMIQSIYWSFTNFGAAALAKEDFWFTFATIKSSDVRKVDGGMSCIINVFLKIMFLAPPHTLHRSGVLVYGGETFGSMRIFAGPACALSDESALHMTWLCKGASGVKSCVQCRNIVSPNWVGLPGLPADSMLKPYTDPATWDPSGWVEHDQYSILAIQEELRAAHGTLGKTAMINKEQALGFSYNANSILQDPETRKLVCPTKHNCFDWPHSLLAGIYPIVVGRMEIALLAEGKDFYGDLDAYMRLFTWPTNVEKKGADGKSVFIKKRAVSSHKHKVWKVSQSEVLSTHAVIAHWVREQLVPAGVVPLVAHCFLVLSMLTHLYVACAKGVVTPEELDRCNRMFLEAFALAFGVEPMVPKFHYILHASAALRRYGFLPNTLALERKHKSIKRHGTAVANHNTATTSVVREVVSHQLYVHEHADWLDLSPALFKPRAATAAELREHGASCTSALEVSNAARFSQFEKASKGDIVAVATGESWYAGMVVRFVRFGGIKNWCYLNRFEPIERGSMYSRWKASAAHECVPLDSLKHVFLFRADHDCYVLLHPHGL